FDAVLRSFRPGDRRGDSGQIQLDDLIVFGGLFGVVPESLLLGVGLDEVDLLRRAAGQSQVLHRLLVDGEDGARGAVFGTHSAQRDAVGQVDVRHAGAEELYEYADDPRLPQRLGYGEDEVCGRCPFGQLTGQLEADDFGDEHAHRLPEHGRLGFDAADAPAEHAEAVDHGSVRIRAHQGVRIGLGQALGGVTSEHDPGQVFEIDLVADSGV